MSKTQLELLIEKADQLFTQNSSIKLDIKQNVLVDCNSVHINKYNLLHAGLSIIEKSKTGTKLLHIPTFLRLQAIRIFTADNVTSLNGFL